MNAVATLPPPPLPAQAAQLFAAQPDLTRLSLEDGAELRVPQGFQYRCCAGSLCLVVTFQLGGSGAFLTLKKFCSLMIVGGWTLGREAQPWRRSCLTVVELWGMLRWLFFWVRVIKKAVAWGQSAEWADHGRTATCSLTCATSAIAAAASPSRALGVAAASSSIAVHPSHRWSPTHRSPPASLLPAQRPWRTAPQQVKQGRQQGTSSSRQQQGRQQQQQQQARRRTLRTAQCGSCPTPMLSGWANLTWHTRRCSGLRPTRMAQRRRRGRRRKTVPAAPTQPRQRPLARWPMVWGAAACPAPRSKSGCSRRLRQGRPRQEWAPRHPLEGAWCAWSLWPFCRCQL